jgi:hypothetical protein
VETENETDSRPEQLVQAAARRLLLVGCLVALLGMLILVAGQGLLLWRHVVQNDYAWTLPRNWALQAIGFAIGAVGVGVIKIARERIRRKDSVGASAANEKRP